MGTKLKLTKSGVEGLSQPGFYWDIELAGFGLRISGATKSYIVQRRINGKDARRVIGRHGLITAESARKLARGLLLQMSNGVDPQADQDLSARDITLSRAYHDYVTRRRLATRTASDYRGYMEKYFRDWSGRAISDIKADMVEHRHKQLGTSHGAAQADVAMRFLRAVFTFAQGVYSKENGEAIISHNPVHRLNALKQWYRTPGRSTYIHESDFALWFAAVNSQRASPSKQTATTADYLLFLAFTGLRRTEAARLRWDYIDFDHRTFTLPAEIVKNGVKHQLPLTDFVFDLLKQRQQNAQSLYVFPGQGTKGYIVEPRPTIKKITEATQIQFTPHDLRRTFATYASAVLDSDWMISRLMNHVSSNVITQQYLHGVERLREPANKIAEFMLSKSSSLPAV